MSEQMRVVGATTGALMKCPGCMRDEVRIDRDGFLTRHNSPATRRRCDSSGMSADVARQTWRARAGR